jgi:RNA-directed DNA polymerase
VQFSKENLLERILSSANLNKAYKQVVSKGGSGGVDKMATGDLLSYLHVHKESLINSLMDGSYRPNPVRRVDIPKGNGKMRSLGIPTVVDRFVQQAISQVLSPIYEREFSASSYGFRPNRSAHQALYAAQRYQNEGYKYAVDLDLEKFFDTVNQSKLIELLGRRIKDSRVLSLIHKYLCSGVVIGHKFVYTPEGMPQGGPLSPLLSNIMLNELDKELENRGHRFVRYADDCMIFCKSKRAAQRTMNHIVAYIEESLHLKVNREKTKVGYVPGMKFLGYSFYKHKGKFRLSVCLQSYKKLKVKLKELTGRSNGMGYGNRKESLHLFIRGWLEYFQYADMQSRLKEIDQWLRRRLRMCIWKSWKQIKTRYRNLVRCGIAKSRAFPIANARQSYWRMAGNPILNEAINNDSLSKAGYPCLMDYYRKIAS